MTAAASSPAARPLAVITGASSGIGLEFARLAARDGNDLVLVARSGPKLEEVAAELERRHGIVARAVVADLAVPGSASSLFESLGGAPVDVLVNNAGHGGLGRFALERELADDLAMIQLDVTSLVELAGLVLPGMTQRGRGGILNVASMAAFVPGPLEAVYFASKAFVKSFSEALTEECRGTGVRVTALCPGPVNTGFAGASGLVGTHRFRPNPIMVSAADVARAGWAGLRAGKAVVVPGAVGKIAVQALRLTPRRLAAQFAKRSQST
ncbi:MAG TPA: SDR family oxidoreductase [Acidimicrobiales bacterium]|nr:SDR family oxidoreductase [Acidimicrobiales bacterium]